MALGKHEQEKPKKLCCSKKIVVVSYVATGLLTATLVLGVFLAPVETSLSPLEVVTGLAWGETAVASGFYYWKARTENKIKLTKAMVDDWADKYGIDAVANLAGIILSE